MKRSTIIRTAAGMGIAAILLTAVTGVANAAPGGPKGGPVGSLVQNGTITRAQADAVKTALEALKAGKPDKLDSLVSNGSIRQSQADAIKAAG